MENYLKVLGDSFESPDATFMFIIPAQGAGMGIIVVGAGPCTCPKMIRGNHRGLPLQHQLNSTHLFNQLPMASRKGKTT